MVSSSFPWTHHSYLNQMLHSNYSLRNGYSSSVLLKPFHLKTQKSIWVCLRFYSSSRPTIMLPLAAAVCLFMEGILFTFLLKLKGIPKPLSLICTLFKKKNMRFFLSSTKFKLVAFRVQLSKCYFSPFVTKVKLPLTWPRESLPCWPTSTSWALVVCFLPTR